MGRPVHSPSTSVHVGIRGKLTTCRRMSQYAIEIFSFQRVACICIFLALRRYRGGRKGDPRLLVLDDIIIISIDLGHSRRLIELLRDEFGYHQILLPTHNGLFAHCRIQHLPPGGGQARPE